MAAVRRTASRPFRNSSRSIPRSEPSCWVENKGTHARGIKDAVGVPVHSIVSFVARRGRTYARRIIQNGRASIAGRRGGHRPVGGAGAPARSRNMDGSQVRRIRGRRSASGSFAVAKPRRPERITPPCAIPPRRFGDPEGEIFGACGDPVSSESPKVPLPPDKKPPINRTSLRRIAPGCPERIISAPLPVVIPAGGVAATTGQIIFDLAPLTNSPRRRDMRLSGFFGKRGVRRLP